ncbi:hypothetical protein G7Y79_00019g047440 [Physcia stellaris]|nr:hypothetical protein G7Y79_00019g047440 [Physcia stellaris]
MYLVLLVMITPGDTSLTVFDPWRTDGPFDFKTPYWRPHKPVSTPGIHLPFPPNDTAPIPSIPYATPHFTLAEVEKLVALAYLNGSNSAAAAAASSDAVFTASTNQHIAAPGSWVLPSVSAVVSTILGFYGKLGWYALMVVAQLLAANVVCCRYLTKQSVIVYKPARPTLPSVTAISTSARGTQTDLLSSNGLIPAPAWPRTDNGTQTDPLTNGSISGTAWPRMDAGTQTSPAPILEFLPTSPLPTSKPARPTSEAGTQTSSPPASKAARPTSEAGTQFSPPMSPRAPSLALSKISSIEILPSSPSLASTPARPTSEAGTQFSPPTSPRAPSLALSRISSIEIFPSSPSLVSTPARRTSEAATQTFPSPASTPARPSSDASSQTSPRPPPTRPIFNPGANSFVPNSGPGAFVPPTGGRGGPGNFSSGLGNFSSPGAPQFGAQGGGGFVPPFGGRGGFVPPFAPQFPGGMPQFPGGGPQFPGGGPQFPGGAPQFPSGAPQFPGSAPQFPSGAPQFPGGGPQFPGGAPQFAGRGGFPSQIPIPFTPANGGTYPSARPKPGTRGGPPVAASSKAEWDAWNARYPQHGRPANP